MNQSQQDERGEQFYADTYDESVPDWPDEIDFYQEMAANATRAGGSVLELACGTGRVAIRLARSGASVVGLDLSQRMLEVARHKSAGLNNIRWVEGNMRSFQLEQVFGLVIIPGHAFQHLNTPEDQAACLECIRRHLMAGAGLVVHLDHPDFAWLGGLPDPEGARFEAEGKFTHAASGHEIRSYRAWSYERSTQTVTCGARWEEIDADGQAADSWQTPPVPLHVVFRFEMEHLFARVGLAVEAVYGDFSRHPLKDKSSDMIWVARAASEIP